VFGILLILWAPVAFAAPGAPTVYCDEWLPVNDGAFGMGTGGDNSYASEEGFEVLVFKDRLYVGMEADNQFGARLWRTRPAGSSPAGQDDWEEVIADGNGCPFGNCTAQVNPGSNPPVSLLQNDHIDSLATFDGYLYASTANGGSTTQGTQVWRSRTGDPGSWTQVNRDGFGDLNNTNFKDMQVFQGWLCGGTQNMVTGAQVWCTADGGSWAQKNKGGFGAGAPITTTVGVWSGYVYGGALYFGAQDTGAEPQNSADDVARLLRVSSLDDMPAWVEVYHGPAASRRADILGDFDDYLYIATSGGTGIVILRSPSGNPGSWEQVNVAGMNNDAWNMGAVVDGAAVYNSALYVAVSNVGPSPQYETHGLEVWRTTGVLQSGGPLVDWSQLGDNGLGDANNRYAELIPFNGDLYAWTSNYVAGQRVLRCPMARHIILMIADGAGANHLAAANAYYGQMPVYQTWPHYWASTYAAGGGYDPAAAWADFNYVMMGATDSAAAATALAAGVKTASGRISVSTDGGQRLFALTEQARGQGRGVGAVTSVDISHATPGAWLAHNSSRDNGYAIADEALWGDPNTTGSGGAYSGGHGPTTPPVDVLIGGGHPAWSPASIYFNSGQRDQLASDDEQLEAFTFVERTAGQADGGARLLAAAQMDGITRLAGLFGGPGGNLEYRLPDGTGHDAENPTLAEMTEAALAVLSRDPNGFVLMVEGGAVDWAAHANTMTRVIGEVDGFNSAVQAVIDWIDRPGDVADRHNSLVIVTADHETGYLTAGPGVFADQPLGMVTTATLALEKPVKNTSRRASWEDGDGDGEIDAGETVYWAWNSGGHTNSLIPVYARGAGASALARYATQPDPVRGSYLDNTNIFQAMAAVTLPYPPPTALAPPLSFPIIIGMGSEGVVLSWTETASAGYEVWQSAAPALNPGDAGAARIALPGATTVYTDTGVLDPARFYTLRGVNDAGASALSPRVGVFHFALMPGE
jgi:alkaline phosphatase